MDREVMSTTDSHMSGRGKLDRWVPGPYVVVILGQCCKTCGCGIEPGATGYKCADGFVRCAEHRQEQQR